MMPASRMLVPVALSQFRPDRSLLVLATTGGAVLDHLCSRGRGIVGW